MENTKKRAAKAAMGLLALVALAMISMACPTETKDSGGSGGGGYAFRTPPKYREMVTLAGGTVSGNSARQTHEHFRLSEKSEKAQISPQMPCTKTL